MRNRILLPLALVLALLPAVAAASPGAERPTVYAGVYLHDVSTFDQANGVFDVDVELWAKWRGDFDRDHLRVGNAADVERTFLGQDDDGDWHSARWRVRGTLRGVFPLDRFPYDEQKVAVILDLPDRYGKLVPDVASSAMSDIFSLTDWLYEPEFRPVKSEVIYPSDLGHLAHEGQATAVHRVSFEVVMIRPIVPVFLKLFLPLGIICLVALLALFVHPSELEARAGMGVTALLSCFAFQFTVADTLPNVAYLTIADTLFLTAYLLSTLAVLITIVAYMLSRAEREQTAVRMDKVGRIVLPVVTLLLVWIALPEPLPEVVAEVAPPPAVQRASSSRDRLRMGTTMLNGITGTAASFGSNWTLLHEDPRAGPGAWFVERAPGIDNDDLRFLAGGKIAVRWRLREGLRWSDGEPVKLEDLLLPRRAMPDPLVEEVRSEDERTMVVVWKERVAYALDAPGIWPSHVLGPVYEAGGGEDGGYDAVRKHKRATPVPALGPYRVTAFEKKGRVEVEANPHFIGPPPAVKRVEIRYFADREALLAAFEAGEVEMTTPNSVTLEQAQAVAAEKPEAAHIRPSAILVYLKPDLEAPLLSRLPVRQAILQALDRKTLARELYAEAGRVAHVPVPGALPAGTVVTAHDPAAARARLEAEGVLGETVRLIHGPSPIDAVAMKLLAADLEAVGLGVEIVQVPSTSRAGRAGGHGGLLLSVLKAKRESAPARYWNLPLKDGNYDKSRRSDAYPEEVHTLVERELRALYPERRVQLKDALFAATSRHLPNLPLVFAAERMLVVPALQGWKTAPEVSFGVGIESWHFEVGAP